MMRTCDITGFKVDLTAERLVKANAVMAVVSFLIGIVGALLLVLTRWPDVHLLSAQWYYRILTLHGINALIFWIVFFEVAGLYLGSTVFLNSRFVAPFWGWLAFILMVTGMVLVDWKILVGEADVLMTSYVPLKAHPLFYLGIILFAVGALIAVLLFFANVVVAHRERTYKTLPLFTFGLFAAACIAFVTLVTGAIVYVPTWLWSMGVIDKVDPSWYRLVWWGLGHPSQQINVAAMIAVWYLVAFLTTGGTSINEKVSRWAFVLYILFINIASAHHLLVDPAVRSPWKVWNTSYAMYLAVLASMIHAFSVPSAIEVAQRKRGLNGGLFQWLAKAPWGNPAFSSLVLSIILFGFIGGTTGVIMGMEQTNIINHNTLTVPGHFKGTVVGGTTLAFMGITYYVIPLIFRRRIVGLTLAKWHPWLFGIGIGMVASSMLALGTLGVPRRHWDVTFSGALFSHEFPAVMNITWVIFGIGGLMAFVGALIWVLVVVASVFFGPKVKGPQDMQLPVVSPAEGEYRHNGMAAPGTLALVLLFLATFIILFFLSWKWLAAVWEIA